MFKNKHVSTYINELHLGIHPLVTLLAYHSSVLSSIQNFDFNIDNPFRTSINALIETN